MLQGTSSISTVVTAANPRGRRYKLNFHALSRHGTVRSSRAHRDGLASSLLWVPAVLSPMHGPFQPLSLLALATDRWSSGTVGAHAMPTRCVSSEYYEKNGKELANSVSLWRLIRCALVETTLPDEPTAPTDLRLCPADRGFREQVRGLGVTLFFHGCLAAAVRNTRAP